MSSIPTLEGFVFRYVHADPDLKLKALSAACQILDGRESPSFEPYESLEAIAKALDYTYQTLWRLKVSAVAEDWAGQPRYKRSAVEAYLKSPECSYIREQLRLERAERTKRESQR